MSEVFDLTTVPSLLFPLSPYFSRKVFIIKLSFLSSNTKKGNKYNKYYGIRHPYLTQSREAAKFFNINKTSRLSDFA